MKIDIHVHTRKIKQGDNKTREITPERFNEIIRKTDVKILAITNHNHFDKEQYLSCKNLTLDVCQIWPGIELDIVENRKRAHLIVIANPQNVEVFDQKCQKLINDRTGDQFETTINEVSEYFGEMDCIFIAHYYGKDPFLSDTQIENLSNQISNPKRIIKEASNSISAGIFVSHGHNSIYGSDVHDWNNYEEISKDLPDLRLEVTGFEQFCLLLEKDEPTIDTVLDKKLRESVTIYPFGVAEELNLTIYNDINILFGSKGTGKTDILKSLSEHFNGLGHRTNVYISNDQHLNDVYDLKGSKFNKSAIELGLDECSEEIESIKNFKNVAITSIGKFLEHFSRKEKNERSKKLKIKSIKYLDEERKNREVLNTDTVNKKFQDFERYIKTDEELKKIIQPKLIKSLLDNIEQIKKELFKNLDEGFIDSKSTVLLNHIVKIFNEQLAMKTGVPQIPTKTGFLEYARNRIKLELAVNKVIKTLNSNINPIKEYVGSLGEKGKLYCQTNIIVQDGNWRNPNYKPISNINKSPQQNFSNKIKSISHHVYSNNLHEKITELNEIENIELVKGISNLLQFNRHFILNDKEYKPSNGESSMILLEKELKENKEIYLLDEPEKSLGNDYINDVIVPIIKNKASLGKKIIIATHDANIAVRTLPYNSIYRIHENGRYFTYTGNPFFNKLECTDKNIKSLDWKEISMKTLEGGKSAFGERGKIYGN